MHDIPAGTVHNLPDDLRTHLAGHRTALDTWRDITPLARNEYICWVENAKANETRSRRLTVTIDKLTRGERRPCCWPGCMHRIKNS